MKRKIIRIIFIIFIILNIFVSTSKAFSLSEILSAGKDFINSSNGKTKIEQSDINNLSYTIYGILQTIAIAATLIVATVLGIIYITGSIETQAEVKKTMIPFVVGCIVAFGAFGIWRLVIEIIQDINI